jgi:hypothetical protein
MTCMKHSFYLVGGFVATLSLAGCSEEPTAIAPRELKIAASDGSEKDSFGASVAISGNTAIVGAVFDDDLGEDSGSAYIFERSDDGTWSQQAKLLAPEGSAGDWFGFAVAISDDTAIVGAPNAIENGVASGSVHIFVRNGAEWTHQAKLVPSVGAVYDQFGYALAIAGDSIIIGAPADDEVAMDAGAAYVFKHSGTSWTEQDKLVPTPGGAAGYYGAAVALSKSTALVGAWDDGSGKNAGLAFVYTTNGMAWTKEATLVATDADTSDTFGYSVALSGDTALIGSNGNDDLGMDSGAAYIFIRTGTTWSQDQKLVAGDGAAGDVFGYSVSIWDDLATVGAYWDDDRGDYSGAAYTFSISNGNWVEQDKHAPADGIKGQKFGCSVALDGDMVIAGAVGDDEKGIESGSAYFFSAVAEAK